MKLTMTIGLLAAISSCSSLTSKGNEVTIVDPDSNLTADCKRLKNVKGYSKAGWGGMIGEAQAEDDARNKAGEIPGADTIVIASKGSGWSGSEVRAVAFNCKEKRVQQIENTTRSQKSEIFEMARKCQKKGGVLINNRCEIELTD